MTSKLKNYLSEEQMDAENQTYSNTEILSFLLDDIYTLSDSCKIAHWNVKGSNFTNLHNIYGDLYDILTQSGDEIAERLRTYGEFVSIDRGDVLAAVSNSNYVIQVSSRLDEIIEGIAASYEYLEEIDIDVLIGLHKQLMKSKYFLDSHK